MRALESSAAKARALSMYLPWSNQSHQPNGWFEFYTRPCEECKISKNIEQRQGDNAC